MAADKDNGRWPGNLHVPGLLTMDEIALPDNSIGNGEVDAADPLDATKTIHQLIEEYRQAGAVTAVTFPLHVARGDGTLVDFGAGMIVPPTLTSTVTITLLKNGVSILSAAFVLDSSNVARVLEMAGITPGADAYELGDWFDLTVAIATPTGVIGSGLYIRGTFREKAG